MNDLLQKAIAEAYASAPVEVQMLHTLELNHKSFTQPARVARWPLEPEPRRFMLRLEDDAAYDPGALAEFIGLPFDISLPEKSENTPGEVNLRICGVGDYFDEDLEAVHLNARIGERLRDRVVELARDRGYVLGREAEGPAEAWPGIHIGSPYLDAATGDLTATGTVLDWINLPFGRLYTPGRYPALVRG